MPTQGISRCGSAIVGYGNGKAVQFLRATFGGVTGDRSRRRFSARDAGSPLLSNLRTEDIPLRRDYIFLGLYLI